MADNIENALYIVATPIGNLDDITLRTLNILKSVDVIACEDTRNTSILTDKYSINTKLISYHKYSEHERSKLFLNYLKEGKSIALVSDAGTPLISDPGNILVKEVIKNNFKVIPIPGASAVIALLSAVNRQDEDFKFIGFLPRVKNQIIEIISKNNSENLVFYESPNRLSETLEIIKEYYKNNILKGEIACLLHKSTNNETNIDIKIKKLKALNYSDKDISIILSNLFEVKKNKIYKRSLEI